MAVPSIKGSAFQSVVEDVVRLVETGALPRPALEAALAAQDLRLLEEKILAGLWYPLDSYRRLTELLMRAEGGDGREYVVARGARAAERLFAAGLYQQLSRGEELGAEKRAAQESWTAHEANLMTTLAGAIFNVSRWRFATDEASGRSRIEVSEATALPEVSRWAAEGFIAYSASRLAGVTIHVKSHRPTPDRVVFSLEPEAETDPSRA